MSGNINWLLKLLLKIYTIISTYVSLFKARSIERDADFSGKKHCKPHDNGQECLFLSYGKREWMRRIKRPVRAKKFWLRNAGAHRKFVKFYCHCYSPHFLSPNIHLLPSSYTEYIQFLSKGIISKSPKVIASNSKSRSARILPLVPMWFSFVWRSMY